MINLGLGLNLAGTLSRFTASLQLAPAQNVADYGYLANSYGTLSGSNSQKITSIIANSTDMRIVTSDGLPLSAGTQLWFVWDKNEIILDWNAGGYYVNAVDHLVYRDHFSRQLGVSHTVTLDTVPPQEPQTEVWERSAAGSLQGFAVRVVQDAPANDIQWRDTESSYPDAFGGSLAWRKPDGVGNSFITLADGLILPNGGTSVMIAKFETGCTISPVYQSADTTPTLTLTVTGTTVTLVRRNPSVTIATVSRSLSVGQHAFVVTVTPIGGGNANYKVYIDGALVINENSLLVAMWNRIYVSNTATITQVIRDENIWTEAQITSHYNGGNFTGYTYPSNVVGVAHGDSLTNHPNRNTWYDTINGLRVKTPSWLDYLKRLHGKHMLGDGYESRKIESADVILRSIQRYAQMPAGTRHFLYLGINNLVITPIATSVTELQNQLLSAIATVEAQGHEAVLFELPPVDTVTTDLVTTAPIYAAYNTWLREVMAPAGYKLIDPKVVLANPGTRVLKSIYNTTKSGAERPNLDPLHYNNYGHRDLAAYISSVIDQW